MDQDTQLLVGREFSREELGDLKYIVRQFSHLSRNELAKTICEGLDWVAPNGKYKTVSCLQLLEKLEASGEITLPEKRESAIRHSWNHFTESAELEEQAILSGTVAAHAPITVEAVLGQPNIRLWNSFVQRYHPLGYKRPFGAHQRYFIWSGAKPRQRLGCMLFSASAWALAERDTWIGWSKEERSQRLSYIVNNTRFLIFPWVKVKNLASKALSLAARQVPIDWQKRYGFEPVLLETFVDIANYRGTCYKAANWIYLGETAGRGRMDRYTQYLSSPKHIYVYPLRHDFRAILHGETGGAR